MQFETVEQAQVGLYCIKQFGAGKYYKAGNMQSFVHVLTPIDTEGMPISSADRAGRRAFAKTR
ncbi:hypothetical protein D3C77_791690 [compost metagenome]